MASAQPPAVNPTEAETGGEGTAGEPLPAEPTEARPPVQTEALEDTASEEIAPPVRQGLEATDPSTVQMASGEVQLVEFFAYW